MPYIATIVLTVLGHVLKPLIGRILAFLGLTFVAMQGTDILLESLITKFESQLAGVPSDVVAYIGMMKLDVVVTMFISAFGIRLLFQGTKKLVFGS